MLPHANTTQAVSRGITIALVLVARYDLQVPIFLPLSGEHQVGLAEAKRDVNAAIQVPRRGGMATHFSQVVLEFQEFMAITPRLESIAPLAVPLLLSCVPESHRLA